MTTHPQLFPNLRPLAAALALCLVASTSPAASAHRRGGDADQQPSQQQQQQPLPQQRPRVTRDAIISRLRAAQSPEQRADAAQSLAAAVRESGVDFDLTPQAEQELRESGATAELVEAVRANLRPFAATVSAPVQRDAAAGQVTGRQQQQPSPSPAERDPAMTDGPPVVTRHSISAGGRQLRYTVTTGVMPLKSATGETEARIFYMAYTLDGNSRAAERPLMFSFNGGPGSSSVWLHLGALGPRRVEMTDEGFMPAPPFRLVDNDQTWLDVADLVFIDPVGTGYSRAARPDLAQRYFGLQGDIQSVGEFIRLYLTRNGRWSSPLFLVGESYGTTRAAGLSGYLIDRGIAFNGVLLVSSILNFQTARFARGNDLPYVLFLPTYTATAWYHKKLPPDLQQNLRRTLEEVERWAMTDYAAALAKGDGLSPQERQQVIDKLARYTGLDKRWLDNNDLRVEIQRFDKELLRDEKRTVGRLDSRFKGLDSSAAGEFPEFDPSMAAIRPPYTAAFNDYVRTELGFRSDLEYFILGGGVGRWDFGSDNAYADTSTALGSAFSKNPHMKLFVASGYYDLATPYFATEYTLDHMGLDPSLRPSVTKHYYEAGHMMYIEQRSLAQLKRDVAAFVQSATARRRN
jgi:carboxypeptidase C (cathepsin A)